MIRCDESKPYIFISYSHRDSKAVVDIINRMSEEGYNVWYDEGIDPGTEWDENIANHVNGCSYFIAFISNGYIGSDNCKDELNYARDLEKERLLVYLEDVDLPMGMAMRMNRIQAIWWNKYDQSNIEDAYTKLYSTSGIEKTKIREKSIEEPLKEEPVKEETVAEVINKTKAQSQKVSEVHTIPQEKNVSPVQQSNKCTKCGYETKTPMRFCRQCGSPMSAGVAEKTSPEMKTVPPVNQMPKANPVPQVNPASKINQAMNSNVMNHMNPSVGQMAQQQTKKKIPVWGWILGGLVALMLLGGVFVLFGVLFIGWFSNETNQGASGANQGYESPSYESYSEDEFYYYNMGINYCKGENGYEQDGYMAIEYFQMAIDSGDDYGYFGIGYVYTGSSTVPSDYELAVEYFDIGLENTGDEAMAYWPAMMYYYGDNTLDPDFVKCLEYSQRAVDAGDMDALGFMAACYYEGGFGIEQDYEQALEYFQEAEYYGAWQLQKEEGGSWFMGCYAYCYAMSGDYENALVWFENAENTGGITDDTHLMMYEAIK